MKAKTKPWMEFAGRDLVAADRLQTDNLVSNIVLYHCQQCIEKCIKALYEENDLHIPRVHATLKLLTDLQKAIPSVPVLADSQELEFIDNIYIDTRYPGAMGLLPMGQPTPKETNRGLLIARKVFEATGEFLK